MPERIQLRRTKGWRKPVGTAAVARPSKWGNPFVIDGGSVYGQQWENVRANFGTGVVRHYERAYVTCSSRELALDHSIDLFRRLAKVTARDDPDRYEQWLAPLRGRDLACWCPLDQPCHADVLLELANGPAA